MSAENIAVLATVVATFIALITAIVLMTRHFVKLEDKVEARLVELKNQFEARSVKLEDKIEARLVKLENQFEARSVKLEDKIEARLVELKNQFEARSVKLEDKIEARLVELKNQFEARSVKLEDKVEARLVELEDKIEALRNGVNQTIRQNNGMLNLFATLIGLLGEKDVIDKKDIGTILRDVTQNLRIGEISPNPISREQADRLNSLIRKAQRGETFTIEEVEDYNRLVRILEEENPDNPDVWALVALDAILLGLYRVSRNK